MQSAARRQAPLNTTTVATYGNIAGHPYGRFRVKRYSRLFRPLTAVLWELWYNLNNLPTLTTNDSSKKNPGIKYVLLKMSWWWCRLFGGHSLLITKKSTINSRTLYQLYSYLIFTCLLYYWLPSLIVVIS